MTLSHRLFRPLATALLALALGACGDGIVVEGVDVKSGEALNAPAAQVEDLGDGTTNEGGPVDMEADLHRPPSTTSRTWDPTRPAISPKPPSAGGTRDRSGRPPSSERQTQIRRGCCPRRAGPVPRR